MSVSSTGGNLTSSISDHFPQFSSLDISSKSRPKIDPQASYRSYKNFNHDEFSRDLKAIQWSVLFENKSFDEKNNIFIERVTNLLDEMAPLKN